jgi:two-component system, NtrC family, response regulator AtoC
MAENTRMSIFLVEDEEISAMVVDEQLKSALSDYQLEVFSSGEECIANLHKKPALILLDYYLPGMNGLETLRKIKSSPYGKNIKVVMLTKQQDVQTALELQKGGAYEYIMKDDNALAKILNVINEVDSYN